MMRNVHLMSWASVFLCLSTSLRAQSADIAVSEIGPASGYSTAGTNATYTLTVSNNGPSNASNVTLSDTLPLGETFVSLGQTAGPTFSCTTGSTVICTLASLAPKVSATFTLVVNIDGAVANGTALSNTATATTSTPDPTPSNNSFTANTVVFAKADVAVTNSGPAEATPGTNATYMWTVTNNGPSSATGVFLSETLPGSEAFVSFTQVSGPAFACVLPARGTNGAIDCTLASLAPGASASFSLIVNVVGSIGTAITNTAVAQGIPEDSNSSNNTASVLTLIATPPVPAPATSPPLLLALASLLALIAGSRTIKLRRSP